MNRPAKPKQSGFNFIELLVVVAVLGMLGALLLPMMVTAKGKAMSMSAQCLNNHKQIISAAIMYADENQDWWPYNMPGANPGWCAGTLDFNAANTANTNTAILKDPNQSVIAPFISRVQILHCPADRSFVTGKGARVRSVSMNHAIGTSLFSICSQSVPCPVNGQWLSGNNIGTGCNVSGFRTYGKTSQMTAPTPGMLWVFTDEHPNGINDATFQVQCQFSGATGRIINYPASYHNGADSLSFADGHVELHSWSGQTIQPPVMNSSGTLVLNSPANDSADDLAWIQAHTSAKY